MRIFFCIIAFSLCSLAAQAQTKLLEYLVADPQNVPDVTVPFELRETAPQPHGQGSFNPKLYEKLVQALKDHPNVEILPRWTVLPSDWCGGAPLEVEINGKTGLLFFALKGQILSTKFQPMPRRKKKPKPLKATW